METGTLILRLYFAHILNACLELRLGLFQLRKRIREVTWFLWKYLVIYDGHIFDRKFH